MYYRVEDKYIIYEDQIAYLINRLKEVMAYDEHSSEDGGYLIRSVYFDDVNDSALFENEGGVDEREKFRIRTYERDDSFIRLEEKSKKSGLTHKESAVISKETARGLLLDGNMAERAPVNSQVLLREDGFLFKKLYARMNTALLHPVTIVEYERQAFVEKVGNVRITFDRNIGASEYVDRFFERDVYARPVMESGAHILEVKYDELLPEYIQQILEIGSLQRTAFSKYTMARRNYEEIGEIL
ncbi:polyphosphate polymerase domain-containing protein [Butyrivibrio sp. CB08]|uniref:polyphosphate polymerase domain-containing protein n=1 Tax=Butyrivibrio sp. CB08 TaxID=2364879 RepID=UPI0013145A9C|nr:polyphosphate polymerase domain-containing protein [Butyrivibrio sp. CB08]